MSYFKAFRADGRTLHGRKPWPLNVWQEVTGELSTCENGLHLMTTDQLCYWPGWNLYEVEVEGNIIQEMDKCAARKARTVRQVKTWTDKTLFRWLADIIERVLPIWEERYPKDMRPREAIEVLRKCDLPDFTTRAADASSNASAASSMAQAASLSDAAVASPASLSDATVASPATCVASSAAYATYAAAYGAVTATATAAAVAAARARANSAFAAFDPEAERQWQNARMWRYIWGEITV